MGLYSCRDHRHFRSFHAVLVTSRKLFWSLRIWLVSLFSFWCGWKERSQSDGFNETFDVRMSGEASVSLRDPFGIAGISVLEEAQPVLCCSLGACVFTKMKHWSRSDIFQLITWRARWNVENRFTSCRLYKRPGCKENSAHSGEAGSFVMWISPLDREGKEIIRSGMAKNRTVFQPCVIAFNIKWKSTLD